MIDIIPKSLEFHDVVFKQIYQEEIVLRNTSSSPVEITLKTTAPSRYSVAPAKARVEGHADLVIVITLRINEFGNRRKVGSMFRFLF
jgi:hypothetical protein